MLRLATQNDLFDIVGMYHEFHKESGYKVATNLYKIPQFVELAITSDDFMVAVWTDDDLPVGFIIGQVASHPLCDDVMAIEHAWFMRDKYRKGRGSIQLLAAYEYWAKEVKGAHHITMVCIEGLGNLDSFYKRMGFTPTEHTYTKRTF